jgi:hypothetical protein
MEATETKVKTKLTKEQIFKDERVFLRYIPNFSNGITDKTHPEYGGLSNNAKIGICAPVLTGRINEIFSDEELEILSKELNEPDLANKSSEFWKEFVTDKHGMSLSIFPIVIKKEGALYNKKNPIDYIYIKILQDSDIIGSSIQNAKEIGAKFALIEEKDQFKKEKEDIGVAKKAFKLYAKYEENEGALRYLLTNIAKAPSQSVQLDFLQSEAWKEMQSRPGLFSKILGDELLDTKIKINAFLKHKLISKSNNLFYMEKGEGIALDGKINDIDGAAEYFASGVGQEKLLQLEARLDAINK